MVELSKFYAHIGPRAAGYFTCKILCVRNST